MLSIFPRSSKSNTDAPQRNLSSARGRGNRQQAELNEKAPRKRCFFRLSNLYHTGAVNTTSDEWRTGLVTVLSLLLVLLLIVGVSVLLNAIPPLKFAINFFIKVISLLLRFVTWPVRAFLKWLTRRKNKKELALPYFLLFCIIFTMAIIVMIAIAPKNVNSIPFPINL